MYTQPAIHNARSRLESVPQLCPLRPVPCPFLFLSFLLSLHFFPCLMISLDLPSFLLSFAFLLPNRHMPHVHNVLALPNTRIFSLSLFFLSLSFFLSLAHQGDTIYGTTLH